MYGDLANSSHGCECLLCFDFENEADSRQGEKRREKARGSSQAKCVRKMKMTTQFPPINSRAQGSIANR